MLISTTPYLDGITIIRFKSRRLRPDALRFLDAACDQSERDARFGIILDFKHVKGTNIATIGALVELLCRHPKLNFAFCSLNSKVARLLQNSGLDRHLRVFGTLSLAAKSAEFQKLALTSTRAVLDIPDTPRAMSDLTGAHSLAELDILGRPLIEHFLANLTSFGVKEALICAPPRRLSRISRLLDRIDHRMCLFFAPYEKRQTLDHIHLRGGFTSDVSDSLKYNLPRATPVLCSSVDRLELLSLRNIHQSQYSTDPSELGTLIPAPAKRDKQLSGYRFLSSASLGNDQVTYPSSIPTLKKTAGSEFLNTAQRRVTSVADYVATLRLASKQVNTVLCPAGEEIDDRIWRGPCAKVSPRARLQGFCYIGAHTTIDPEVALKCFNVIGQNAMVGRRTILDDCIVLPGTKVAENRMFRNCALSDRDQRPINEAAVPLFSEQTPVQMPRAQRLGAA